MGQNYWTLTEIERENWNSYWKGISRANLTQSWEYGEAKCAANRWKPKRFLLKDEENQPQGILQILVRTLPFIGGVARINRGPLFFASVWDNNFQDVKIRRAFEAIVHEARHQRWWYLSFAPELPHAEKNEHILKNMSFRYKNIPAWGSSILSLYPSLDNLHKGLHGKWRNLLRKAEKLGVVVEDDVSNESVSSLIKRYIQLQQEKKFQGVPDTIIRQLAIQEGPYWHFGLLSAYDERKVNSIGMLVSVGHGDTCTYLIGWTSNEGRRLQANYLLLWKAIVLAKERGYAWFDLGGLNEKTAKGIAHFKKGLKGSKYRLIGEWGHFILPFWR